MNAAYTVTDMTAAHVDRAFPLAAVACEGCSLSDWQSFCQRIIAARSEGVMTETLLVCGNARGYLKGLCLVRVSQTDAGRVLDVPLCVIATAVDEEGVRSALHDQLKTMARRLGAERPALPT